MKNWEGDDTDTYCPAADDLADATAVCDKLGIPLTLVNFASEYWSEYLAIFYRNTARGRTPNPDILCNREIKFKAFLDYAKQQGADAIATGHYVRKDAQNHLLKGSDPPKYQSYFLYALHEAQLKNSIFPVGALPKTEVRAIAARIGFINHAKWIAPVSCFIGERKFKTFLNEYLPAQPGNIETLEGETIGRHDGLMFYTIGQRQGLQIGGRKGKSELPWYVATKDLKRNVLLVVQGEHPALYQTPLTCSQLTWTHAAPPLPGSYTAKTRYRQPGPDLYPGVVENDRMIVQFDTPQRAITPGQSIVFYQDDICLGGGIIES